MSFRNTILKAILRWRVKPNAGRVADVKKLRATAERLVPNRKPPRGWRVTETFLPPLKGEWIEPDLDGEPAPGDKRVILYFHGGGYFFYSPRSVRSITFALGAGTGARVFALDYRLAPEHRFPAALDDAVAAYRRLMMDGIAAKNVVIAGDSAGGGLALATLVKLRDEGDPLPAGAVLFSPWTDLAATGASMAANDALDPMFQAAHMPAAASHYLGDMPATHPEASPLYAALHGLPPLFIQASRIEILLDDSQRVVEKARTAGTEVLFKSWPDLPHVWQFYTPFLPEARAALKEACIFVVSRLGAAGEYARARN